MFWAYVSNYYVVYKNTRQTITSSNMAHTVDNNKSRKLNVCSSYVHLITIHMTSNVMLKVKFKSLTLLYEHQHQHQHKHNTIVVCHLSKPDNLPSVKARITKQSVLTRPTSYITLCGFWSRVHKRIDIIAEIIKAM